MPPVCLRGGKDIMSGGTGKAHRVHSSGTGTPAAGNEYKTE